MNIILFIGNGINRVEGVAISWDDLLGDLSSEKTRILSDYLGMTLRFEYIDAVSPNKAIDIKRAVAKKTQETALQIIQKKHSIHKRVMLLPVQTILTTNYDYSMELSADSSFQPLYSTKERLYSFYRKQCVADKTVYHIHGECLYPQSICLGFEHYAGILEKMRSRLVLNTKTKAAGNNRFHIYDVLQGLSSPDDAWYYEFFRNNIYFLGFGFDQSEEDIWWLITYRKRLKDMYPDLVKNKLVLLDTTPKNKLKEPKEEAIRKVLVAMDVEIEEQTGRTYREKYMSALAYLGSIAKQEDITHV